MFCGVCTRTTNYNVHISLCFCGYVYIYPAFSPLVDTLILNLLARSSPLLRLLLGGISREEPINPHTTTRRNSFNIMLVMTFVPLLNIRNEFFKCQINKLPQKVGVPPLPLVLRFLLYREIYM